MKIKTLLSLVIVQDPQFKKFIGVMKVSLFLSFICIVQLMAVNTNAQKTVIQFSEKTITVGELIKEIEKQTDYLIVFRNREVNTERKLQVNEKSDEMTSFLRQAFENSEINYEFENRYIILSKKEHEQNFVSSQSNKKKISGTILDSNREPVIGANVVVKGTTNGTVTDVDGRFTLDVDSQSILHVSFIGYLSQEIPVGDKMTFDIRLREDTQALEEVVVVGYGVQKKTSISGSVASIPEGDIKRSSTSNVSDALVGRLPGLIAINENGKVGGGSKLFIRGQGTWNNSDPLVIVDGVERDFTTLDPNEIETISILKDAAAAAVYGARAANGVILVTSKRGKDGKPSISLDTYYGLKDYTRYPKIAGAYEYASTRNKAYLMDGVDPSDPRMFTPEQLEEYRLGKKGTDWVKETLNDSAPQYYANISLSGGSGMVKYFVSLGHHREDGLIDNNSYKKYNARSNIDAKLSNRFSVSADVDMRTRKFTNPGFSVDDIFNYLVIQNPTFSAYHPNGLPYNTTGEHLPEMIHSTGYNDETYNDLRLTFKTEYKIPWIEGLTARGMFSYGKEYMYGKKFFTPYSMYDFNEKDEIINTKIVGEKTKLNEKFNQKTGYTYNVSLNYNQTFGLHDVGALILYEEESNDYNEFSAFRTNFVSNSLPQLSAGGDADKNNSGKANEWARNGLVGRINYAYDSKYMLEASFRYDGSITFPKGHRYGFFPSVSAAWRISQEPFIKDNLPNINNLKLRASYGTLGNDRVALWQYMTAFIYMPPATIGDKNVGSIAVDNDLFPNPNITWEKSSTLDLGIEGMLWKGLLNFEIDYFHKRTYDILARQIRTIPETFGATLPDVNYGVLINNGVEVMLSHSNKIGDVSYRIGGNVSYVKNKVSKFDEALTTPDYYKVVGKSFTHVTDGRPYAGLVGMKALGIFQTQEEIDAWYPQFNGGQKPGDIKYDDVNKDGIINENDLTIVSKYGSIPEFIYGFNLSASWKGFEIRALFQGAANKAIMLSSFGSSMFIDGSRGYYSYLSEESWTPEKRDAQYPRIYVGGNSNNNRASNIWVKNGNYLRLKNIEMSYSFPSVLLNKTSFVKGLRLYINGTNLLTFDSLDIMDPETPSGSAQYYPQMKSINFGLNIIY